MTYPSASGNSAGEPIEYDVSRHGFTSDEFAEAIGDVLRVPFSPKKPLLTKKGLIQLSLGAALVCVVLFVVPRLSFNSAGRAIFMLISLALIFAFTSGYMWNRIRNPPFMLQGPGGNPTIFMQGFQAQTGVESPILVAIYAGIALCIIALNNVAPFIRSGPLQLLVVLAGVAGLLGGFSALMDVFRRKKYVVYSQSPYYPFHLFI